MSVDSDNISVQLVSRYFEVRRGAHHPLKNYEFRSHLLLLISDHIHSDLWVQGACETHVSKNLLDLKRTLYQPYN